ncbi:hypothetical protein [Mucilaginibacter sp.]|uniref:hypothetical protein n=1 Tax=Mucilaginibacter sp. TaxID=1882438 RepID=UPI003D1285A8
MSKEQPTKPEYKDPIKEAISHPDGASLEEMIDGQEEVNKYPNQNEKDEDAADSNRRQDKE